MIVSIDDIAGDEKTISTKRECQRDIYSRFVLDFYVLFKETINTFCEGKKV